ncbi:hypothetical protein TNCV_4761431 [Trichonephila clavipes]|uniref:Uncharacterized protein n=1 Tax=Trichonephila clavipes TaxID=2585209 RepID=A0A8X6RJ72_TRICX|nr:hypothetical protein TNCV_4761431 [Trichonephila clavipes]
MKQAYVLAEDRQMLLTFPISQHGGQTQVRETNDLIENFETTSSELCDMTNKFEDTVTGLKKRWEGVDVLQFIGQAYPTHVLLDSSRLSMLVNPYGSYPPIEGIHLQCLHGEDGRCHP